MAYFYSGRQPGPITGITNIYPMTTVNASSSGILIEDFFQAQQYYGYTESVVYEEGFLHGEVTITTRVECDIYRSDAYSETDRTIYFNYWGVLDSDGKIPIASWTNDIDWNDCEYTYDTDKTYITCIHYLSQTITAKRTDVYTNLSKSITNTLITTDKCYPSEPSVAVYTKFKLDAPDVYKYRISIDTAQTITTYTKMASTSAALTGCSVTLTPIGICTHKLATLNKTASGYILETVKSGTTDSAQAMSNEYPYWNGSYYSLPAGIQKDFVSSLTKTGTTNSSGYYQHTGCYSLVYKYTAAKSPYTFYAGSTGTGNGYVDIKQTSSTMTSSAGGLAPGTKSGTLYAMSATRKHTVHIFVMDGNNTIGNVTLNRPALSELCTVGDSTHLPFDDFKVYIDGKLSTPSYAGSGSGTVNGWTTTWNRNYAAPNIGYEKFGSIATMVLSSGPAQQYSSFRLDAYPTGSATIGSIYASHAFDVAGSSYYIRTLSATTSEFVYSVYFQVDKKEDYLNTKIATYDDAARRLICLYHGEMNSGYGIFTSNIYNMPTTMYNRINTYLNTNIFSKNSITPTSSDSGNTRGRVVQNDEFTGKTSSSTGSQLAIYGSIKQALSGGTSASALANLPGPAPYSLVSTSQRTKGIKISELFINMGRGTSELDVSLYSRQSTVYAVLEISAPAGWYDFQIHVSTSETFSTYTKTNYEATEEESESASYIVTVSAPKIDGVTYYVRVYSNGRMSNPISFS